jgi:hypothetical protein
MLAKHERTKYELAVFDDFPMVAMGRRRANGARNRACPACDLARIALCRNPCLTSRPFLPAHDPGSGHRFSEKIMRKREN